LACGARHGAIEFAQKLYEAGVETSGKEPFDFELSIDETDTPTTPQAHLFVARETLRSGVRLMSLAPRFIGDFQKGIDYIGNPSEFEKSLRIHAAIARKLEYRLSVHSGSDKFSIFPAVGRGTQGRFHIKTSGTNWLVALKVISELEPGFFRTLYGYAREKFETAREYYHVTGKTENAPEPSSLDDSQLPTLFENVDARQVLHITYGEMLADKGLREKIYDTLDRHLEAYWKELEGHIGYHLESLGVANKRPRPRLRG
jgi:hypothetical protein